MSQENQARFDYDGANKQEQLGDTKVSQSLFFFFGLASEGSVS